MSHSKSRFYHVFLLLSIFILPSLVRAQTFEGEITLQMSSPMMGNEKIDILSSVKGDKVVQSADDPKQGKVIIYTDMKTGSQIIVQPAFKKGMEIDQATMDEALKSLSLPVLIPKPSGKTAMYAGYNCEMYTITLDTAQEMEIWLTKEFPKDISQAIRNCTEAGMKSTGVKCDALLNLFNSGYAKVRMEMKYKGTTQLVNEFIKAEAKKLDNSLFTISSDIVVTKFDPKTMMGAPPPESGTK